VPTKTFDAAALLQHVEHAQGERVKLADIARPVGWDATSQSRALAEGLLEAERLGGQGNPYGITRDDAMRLLLAAVLAVAAGVAIAAMLRGLRDLGVTGDSAAEVLHRVVQT
jgi:hypothetical protein